MGSEAVRTLTRRQGLGWVLALAAGLLSVGSAAALPALADGAPPRLEYVVIGNATGLVGISEKQAQAILRGERTLWESRVPVTVVLPGQRAAHGDSLARDLMGMSRAAMQRFWLALVFQGRAAPPVFHDSVEDTVAYVRRTPGAIAVIPAGQGGDIRDLLIPWR